MGDSRGAWPRGVYHSYKYTKRSDRYSDSYCRCYVLSYQYPNADQHSNDHTNCDAD
jgi:hypothetical protein